MEKVHPSRLMNISLLPIGQIKWMLQPLTSFPALDWGIRMFNMIPRTRTYKKRPLKISHAFPAISDFFFWGGVMLHVGSTCSSFKWVTKKMAKTFPQLGWFNHDHHQTHHLQKEKVEVVGKLRRNKDLPLLGVTLR